MATSLTQDSSEIRAALVAGRWNNVVELYEKDATRQERNRPEFRLPYAIALILTGREADGLKRLTSDIFELPEARDDVRRYVISHLIRSGSLEKAASLLLQVIEANPESVEDLRLAGSLYGRLRKPELALQFTRRLIELRPDDLTGQASYLQGLMQSGQAKAAAAHALTLRDLIEGHSRLASIVLLALTRGGCFEEAAEIASTFDETAIADDALAGAIVRALVEAGRKDEAIAAGERLLRAGWDDPVLRSYLGQAFSEAVREDRYDQAIAHFRAGLALAPEDFRMNSALGDALLRSRGYEQALPYLEKAASLQPKSAQTRALYARALKQSGRFADAAREFRQLLEMQPSAGRWRRYAAGALSQAGNKLEAAALFDSFVAERRKTLPKNFEDGLEALWDKVDSVQIPQARLDWAWSFNESLPNDRDEWERQAKWGHLADHYLLDWLECRDDRIHEAMARLADLSEAERALSGVDRSNGLILASAHIGPMYAGPLALELLGVRSRWLASTPSVARTSYASSLISTSDQDDMHVARAYMESLRQGFAGVIAIDGAINLAAPRISFEGQEMTYSSFAARTAHRLGIPSMFCAPRWEEGKIGFVLERMPDPLPNEDANHHADRWRGAFLNALGRYLGGRPENLRLSGGLWRHIR